MLIKDIIKQKRKLEGRGILLLYHLAEDTWSLINTDDIIKWKGWNQCYKGVTENGGIQNVYTQSAYNSSNSQIKIPSEFLYFDENKVCAEDKKFLEEKRDLIMAEAVKKKNFREYLNIN